MRTKRLNTVLGLGAALVALVGVSAGTAQAQTRSQTQDSRWLPWLGCWQAEGAPSDAGLLCVRPLAEETSVEILRVTGSDVVSREVVWADGQQHETSREGCDGWEKGAFSSDGQRVYLSSSHTCDGNLVRAGGGIMSLVSPTEWLDVRYVGMGDERTPWVQRYRLATAEQTKAAGMSGIVGDREWAVQMARMNAANAPSVDDIIEASAQEPSEVVEAWVAERKAPMTLNAKALSKMADAGVAGEVIDVAVAVSYPDHFNVRAERPDRAADNDDRYAASPFFYQPYYYDPFYYGYGYGYGMYGYGYPGGYYGGYYGGGYTPVIVISNTDETPVQHGRVIAGRGYTRGGSSGSTGSTAGPARSSAPPSSSAGRSSSGSSSSSGSTGRTAHRRGGGGGGGH